ncbi:hypothetical protein PybrP1_012683 [[Pythium] brassicae (nom. inval.)]|nr:hypothetical protein PybrP1_012683 [[Pythium] brassicae (nom. inval.)]
MADEGDDAALLAAAGDDITRAHWEEQAERARRPLWQREARRCACGLGAGCALCGRCLEMHCTCGMRERHRGLCLESRPCDCALADPRDRCALCRGCRRAHGFSHCRCAQHERQRRRLRGSKIEAKTEADAEPPCACFSVATSAIPRVRATSADRALRIRRLQRAMGVPSVENVFQKTIVPALGAADSSDDDNALSPAAEDSSVRSVLPDALTKRLFPLSMAYAPPYQALHLRNGVSYLEAIEPRDENDGAAVGVFRGLDPHRADQEGLVDYVVRASSIKVGRASELVGTFDDSAAVAAAIVVEEYMKQVVGDLLAAENRHESALSKPQVQAFATHLLEGLNWSLFRVQQPDSKQQEEELVRAIEAELAAVGTPTAAQRVEVIEWIRETASQYATRWKAADERALAAKQKNPRPNDAAPRSTTARLKKWRAADPHEPHLRLGVRQHAVSGQPSYHFTMETKLPGDQLVHVAVNDLDTQEQALRRVDAVKETLRAQHERLATAVHGRLPVLKQQLLSAELERSVTGRVHAGKLSAADKRLLALTDPDVRAKLERRRLQQRVWRQQDTAKKRKAMGADNSLGPLAVPDGDPTRRPMGRPRKVRDAGPADAHPAPARRPRGRPRKVRVVEATEPNESTARGADHPA